MMSDFAHRDLLEEFAISTQVSILPPRTAGYAGMETEPCQEAKR